MARVLCVDVGSTFTKAVLVDAASGAVVGTASHPTTVATDVMDARGEIGVGVLVWWGLTEGPGLRIMAWLATVAGVLFATCIVPAIALSLADRLLWLAAFLAGAPALLALYGRFG